MIWRLVVDKNSKQSLRVFDRSLAKFSSALKQRNLSEDALG